MRQRHHQRARPIGGLIASVGAATIATAALAVAVTAVGSLPAGGQVAEQHELLLDFEDLPYQASGEFQPVLSYELTDFYADRGVTFEPPVLGLSFDSAEVLELATFASSGSGFLAPLCPESIIFPQAALVEGVCRPVSMRFETEMSSIGVFVGATPSNENRTLTLEALDANGDPIVDDSVTFPETGDLTPLETALVVSVDEGGVFGARLYWIGGSTSAFFVDDIGLTPFVGTPDIRARESGFTLVATADASSPTEAVSTTVVFDNLGTGPALGHRVQLVASEPFDGNSLRLETIECVDPLDRGGSCAFEVILDPGEFSLTEPGEYTGGAELWFEDSSGSVLETVDLDLTVVVAESESTVTTTTTAENTESTPAATPSTVGRGDDDPSESGPDSPYEIWLIVVAIAAAAVWIVRRTARRTPVPQDPPPPPARSSVSSPPPPPPATPAHQRPPPPAPSASSPPPPAPSATARVPPPYRITVRNTAGRQRLARGDRPLLVITATRPPARIVLTDTSEAAGRSGVSVTESDSP